MRLLPYTVRRRLAVLIALFSTLGAMPVYFYIDYIHSRQLVTEREAALQNLANAVATLVSENLRERQREIERLAQTPLLRNSDPRAPDVVGALDRLQRSYPHYSWIGLADPDGIVQASSGGLLEGQSVAQRPWFIAGREGSYIGDLHEALLLAKLLPHKPDDGPTRFIDFTTPIYDASRQLKGVLAAHAHWRWAGSVIGAISPMLSRDDHIDIMLVDRSGKVLYPETPGTPKSLPASLEGEGRSQSFHTWDDGSRYLTAMSRVPEVVAKHPLEWQVVVRQPRATALATLHALQRTLLVSGAALLAVLIALAFILARQISRPIEKLARLARRVEQGDGDVRFDIPASSAEVHELVEAMRGMASTLLARKQALEANNQQLEATVQARTSALSQANAELTQLARHDTLTGLPNRRAIDDRVQSDFTRWRRQATPYAVLVIDIDHFKRVNDTYGHAAGDAVLQRLATLLGEQLRDTDLCGRQGGEEFLVVLALDEGRSAWHVAERLRATVAAAAFPHVGHLTISIGLAWSAPGDTHAEQIVQRADAELYAAKQSGRNRVHPLAAASLPSDPADTP